MSNIIDLPPNDKSGMYKAPPHSKGGFRLVIDNHKVAEAEGYEIELCPSVLESNEILHYENKTNKQILDDIFQKNACVMTQGYTSSGSFIVCKKAVLDDTKKSFNGSIKDFLNSIQIEHGCNVTEDAKEEFKKEKGGEISNEKEFIKNEIDKHFNISGKYKEKGIGFMKGVRQIYTDGIYASKNVLKPVQKDAEKLYYALINGDVSKIKEIRDKYYPEWNKSHSLAGTQRDRFVRIDTSKIELYNTANAVMIYIDNLNKKIKEGIKVEEEHRDTVEKLAKGEISADEGVKEIAKVHLAEDSAYYDKLETVESPFYKFIEIVDTSKDFDEAYSKAKQVKDVPSEVATAFYEKYNPEGKLSMEQSFRKFYDEYKKDDLKFKVTEHEMMYKGNPNAKWVKVSHVDKDGNTFMQGIAVDLFGSKEKAIDAAKEKIKAQIKKDSEKQELQDLIDLLKDAVKENPEDQESKDLLELYEENLKELNAKFEEGGEIKSELLAPNGKKSNLTPEQYKLVRTPEFKKWFGDWENDPENSSKVVDDNGEPLVVYHGTNNKFNIFDINKVYRGGLGNGFYFTETKEKALNYGENIINAFISLKKPINVKGSNAESDLRDIIGLSQISTEKEISEKIKKLQFDGVIKSSKKSIFSEIAVFNSSQIKLADGSNTTFDENNPDIRFEKGGELNAEESILNAPCVNKKFKFVESSDYNEYRKGGSINSMSKKELEDFYNTKEGKELDRQTYNKWKKLVNMSKSELEKFYNSEEGKEAGLSASESKEKGIDSGRESARWIMKMKDIPYTEWTSNMWMWAKKQISFISRMSGMKGDLYDDKGNKTRKHTALLIWGHNPEKYEDGGAVSFDKLITASSRFRPTETVLFDPPLEGKNGAKLISYTWSYEWTMTPNHEGELKSKRVSDWSQAEISADTGRDIVHQYTVLMPNGEYKTVSSDSVPVLLGYIDKKELKSFPNLVTASKTLAKQQMQLAIMEAQKKEYDELYSKFEKAEKPEIKEVEETSKFSAAIESWKKGAYSNYAMGDIIYRQDNDYVYETKEYKKRPITKDTIEQLTSFWISKRVEEAGGINPRGLYDLKNRVARQKRKVENILNTKMENGGEIEDFDWESLYNPSPEEEEKIKQEIKKSEEQEKEDWYQNTKFSKKWAATYKDAVNRTVKEYLDAKATYDDWASRQYKQNKGMVFLGGDDIFGEAKSIGSINEGRRQRVLRGAKMQMDESIETLKELRLTDAEINELLFDKKGTIFADGGKIEVNKVSVYQTNFSGLYFSDLGGYFDSNFTEVIDLEDKNIILKDLPIFLFFKNPYDTRYSEKISIDDVIGAVIPKKMEKDARTIFDKRFISYVTYNDDANNEDKIEAIKKLADINDGIILK